MIISSLGAVGVPCDAEVLSSGSVNAWVSIRVPWGSKTNPSSIQPNAPVGGPTSNPSDPSWNWTFLDSEIARVAAAGKGIHLRVLVQNNAAPSWLYALPGMQSYTTSLGNTIWVWWNTVAQSYLLAMYQALAARYGSNPNLKVVAVEIANVTSGDWVIPHQTNEWTTTANWHCPPYGGSATVFPIPTAVVYVGQVYQVNVNGLNTWFQVTAVNGPNKGPTSVTLLNLGLPGSANSTTVGMNKRAIITDIENLVSPIYGYESSRLIGAVQNVIDTMMSAFPSNVIMTLACGRDGHLDPTSGGVLPGNNYNQNYVCEQIVETNIVKYGTRFAIQKNQLNATTPPPPTALKTNSNFTILAEFLGQLIIGMQATAAVFGDSKYRDNGGKPAPGAQILNQMLMTTALYLAQDFTFGTPGWFEAYQSDVENYSAVFLPYIGGNAPSGPSPYQDEPGILAQALVAGAHFIELYDIFQADFPAGGNPTVLSTNQELVQLGILSTEPAQQPGLNLNEVNPFTVATLDPYPWSQVTVAGIVPLIATVL